MADTTPTIDARAHAEMLTGALPAAGPGQRSWRAVLLYPQSLAEAEKTYRDLIRTSHPDAGGTHEAAAELTAAIAEARKELK